MVFLPVHKEKSSRLMRTGILARTFLFIFIILFTQLSDLMPQDNQTAEDKKTGETGKIEKKDPGLLNKIKVNLVNYIIHDNLPRKFNFDKMNVSMFGYRAEFLNLRISENPEFGNDDFFYSDAVDCNIEFLPFIFGRLNIEEISVNRPVISIIRNSSGSLSLVDLLKSVEKKKALVDWMQISSMVFRDGVMRLTDNSQRNGPVILAMDSMDLSLENFKLGSTCSISVSGRLPGSESKNFVVSGAIGPMKNSQNIDEIPVEADIKVSDISIEPYKIYVPDGLPFYPVSGTASADVRLDGVTAQELTVVGGLDFKDLVLANNFDHGSSKSTPLAIRFNDKTRYRPAAGNWTFDGTEVIYSDHKFLIFGILKGINERSSWDVNIRSKDLKFDTIRNLYPSFDEIIPLTADYTGSMDIDLMVQGNLSDATGSVKFAIDGVRVLFFKMILKQKNVPAFVEIRGDKNFKNIVNIDGNFFFKEVEVLRFDVINAIVEDLFDKLVTFSKFVSYGQKIKESVQQFITFLQSEKLLFENIAGAFYFSSYALDVKEISLPYVEMKGLGGSDIILKGAIPLQPEGINFKVKIFLSKKVSEQFVKSAEPLRVLLNSEGNLMLPIDVTGSFQKLDITLDMQFIARILKQKGLL